MGRNDPKNTAKVTVTGGRAGHAVSDDGALDVQLRLPKTNGASGGTNPEQLFAAAWGACYQSALLASARNAGVDASNSTVRVDVSQGPDETGGYGLAARIAVEIPGLDRAKARELADAAHAMCPYSRATRGNVDVEVSVV
jgi:Ohr subfamily peroxiredoxin